MGAASCQCQEDWYQFTAAECMPTVLAFMFHGVAIFAK